MGLVLKGRARAGAHRYRRAGRRSRRAALRPMKRLNMAAAIPNHDIIMRHRMPSHAENNENRRAVAVTTVREQHRTTTITSRMMRDGSASGVVE